MSPDTLSTCAPEKVCRECGQAKPLEAFRQSSLTTDGREGKCRDCRAAADRERRRHRDQASIAKERARNRDNRRKAYAAAMTTEARDIVRWGKEEAERRARARQERSARLLVRLTANRQRRDERQRLHAIRAADPEWQRTYWRRYQRWRRRAHRLRSQARRAVQHAVERRLISKPEHCSTCFQRMPPELLSGHHHLGYAPGHHLDVLWVCTTCHVREEGGWGGQLRSDGARPAAPAALNG